MEWSASAARCREVVVGGSRECGEGGGQEIVLRFIKYPG